MSEYRGMKEFDRAQLILVVSVIMSAAVDRVESILPCTPSDGEMQGFQARIASGQFPTWQAAAVETAGMALATLSAQLNGEGMAICDAVETSGLDDLIQGMVAAREEGWDGKAIQPETRILAAKFVDKVFAEYAPKNAEPSGKVDNEDGWDEFLQDATLQLRETWENRGGKKIGEHEAQSLNGTLRAWFDGKREYSD